MSKNKKKLFGQAMRSPIFSMVSFVAIIFIYECSSISRVSQNPSPIMPTRILKTPIQAHNNGIVQASVKTLEPSSDIRVSYNVTEELEEDYDDGDTSDPLIPPAEFTSEERMKWFREKLPGIEILKSTKKSQKFHDRVLKFFKNQCTIQFYMIWFSPARTFGPRDFLAVDTLMKANPQSCLVLISTSLDKRQGYKILKPLLDRGLKILAVTPDLPSLVKDTPAESWLKKIQNGEIDPGKNSLTIDLSDLIRIAVLYKYGGVYLDMDFIILKDFKGLSNALGVQDVNQVTQKWTTVNSAAMIFDKGHPILFDFLQEFANTFDGSIWGHNGPYLFTRVIKRIGNTPRYNLTILGMKAFYPVNWVQINRFYKKPANEEESKWVEEKVLELNKETYGLHLWNKITRGLVINEGSVIDKLIKAHCLICQDTYNS